MSDIYFTFGPDRAFWFDGPKCYESDGIPEAFWAVTGSGGIQKIWCLAMNDFSDGEIFLVYEDTDGEMWSWSNETMKEYSHGLLDLMAEEGTDNCRIVFGPKGTYCAWKAKGNWLRCYTDRYEDFEQDLNQTDGLAVCALGLDCAYFLLQKDGRFWFDLRGNYDALEAIMEDLRPGEIEFLALNPFYVGEFFILLANRTAVFQVPMAYKSKLEEALAKHDISCSALTSQRVDDSPSIPQRARSTQFAKGLLKSLAGNTAGGIISGVASSLIGAVSCTVM